DRAQDLLSDPYRPSGSHQQPVTPGRSELEAHETLPADPAQAHYARRQRAEGRALAGKEVKAPVIDLVAGRKLQVRRREPLETGPARVQLRQSLGLARDLT